jgi:molybdopterin synthase catalytic subunit
MFSFSHEPLPIEALSKALTDPRAGAFGAFEGRVRNHNEGKTVTLLEYEADQGLGIKEALKIIEEARQRWSLIDVSCRHRVGTLAIGDAAIWVGVLSAHRGEAFAACQYIVDEIKHRLPIWKKEHYEDGSAEWVNCRHVEEPALRR